MEMVGSTATRFSPLINIIFFTTTIFLFLPKKCQSIDNQQYQDCAPQNCGDGLNISYPFYIKGQQKPYCGYPGFDLSCNTNNHPIFNTSTNNSFVVYRIFYTNQTFRINYDNCSSFTSAYSVPSSPFEIPSIISDSIGLHGSPFEIIPSINSDSIYYVNCGDFNATADNYERVLNNNNSEWIFYITLNWAGPSSKCSACRHSGGRCGFDHKTGHFICFCQDRPRAWDCPPISGSPRKIKNKIKVAIAASAAGFGVLIIIAYCYSKKFFSTKSLIFWKKEENLTHQNVETFLKNAESFALKRYSYSDVKRMTNSFKDKLGQGGFGCVYKGKLHDDCLVAVKILNNSKGKNGEEFVNELASISRTSHVNIVTLLGFCFDGSHKAIIYEFVPNGSLEKFIYDEIPLKSNRKLGWETLYQIAIGIARGLEYLHRGCNTRILHFDIKPHNILLDDDFCPKISDFGLAKLCPKKESVVSMLGARGTTGYIAPEVFCRNIGGVSHKSDVYSFGMMVLEMVGGRKNINIGVGIDHTSEIYFPHWIYNRIESNNELGLRGVEFIMNEEENEKARKMILVSLWCIQTDPSNRPPMSRVLEMLEGKLESLQIPPKPFLSSTSRAPPDSSTTPVETLIQL